MTNNVYTSNCPHKLPCGLCKLTMMNCPKSWWTYNATSTGVDTVNLDHVVKESNDATVDCGWK